MSEAGAVMAATTRNAEDLLIAAAKFAERDPGSPGFLDRFTRAVQADPAVATRLLSQVLAARERVGKLRFTLWPGDLEVVTTSAGATVTACALAGPGGALAASVRVTDAARHPVSAAALRVTIGDSEDLVVTDPGGRVSITGTGLSMEIVVGEEKTETIPGAAAAAEVIELPRILRREGLSLAAAVEAGAEAEQAQAPQWPIPLGDAELWGMEREGGYDLTILVRDISGTFAAAAGAHAVAFTTQDRDGHPHRWVVPLAPGPQAFAGTLYGTDADSIRKDSVAVRDSAALLAGLGQDSDEVIRRSVMHADTGRAWLALAQRLPPGPLRDSVNDALARRAST
jgi:hypothetical protein